MQKKKYFNVESSGVEKEAEQLLALNHPHLIKLVFKHEGSLYLELAESSLENLIKKGPLEEVEFVRIYSQIAQGIAYMHSQGYLHGDLKKENILLKNQNVKISDFGTATKISEFSYHKDKKAETSFNSPPEHLNHQLDASNCLTIDVWAFGLLLWNQLKEEKYQTPYVSEYHPLGSYNSIDQFEAAVNLVSPEQWNIKQQIDVKKQAYYDPSGTITDLMLRCLDLNPCKRPTMNEIETTFTSL